MSNREKLKTENPKLYDRLISLNVSRMIVAPIRIGDVYQGFLGMMDPPGDNLQDIADILEVVEFFISEMIRRRSNERILINYSYYDQMTEVKNRRAQEEFETTEFDPSKPYGYIMCDINGLKRANAAILHIQAIQYIRDTAGLEILTPPLREAAEARLSNPEAPLTELASMMTGHVGKSGMNHRLKKIMSIASELREERGESSGVPGKEV